MSPRAKFRACMQGRILDTFLGFEFQKDRLKNVGAMGSNFWLSHWLGTSLIQQLVAIAQAVIYTVSGKKGTNSFFLLNNFNKFRPRHIFTTYGTHYLTRLYALLKTVNCFQNLLFTMWCWRNHNVIGKVASNWAFALQYKMCKIKQYLLC